ncbi:MAG TPA: hypothetical protein VJP79_10540 [Nitrososphaera sp.]|nr:hypothetical protein [Nitrososphaera sp.]
MYKPKDTKDIYVESLSINSSNLEKQLEGQTVSPAEIRQLLSAVDGQFRKRLAAIVEDYQKDMMALENVPSPLRLFIECLAESEKSLKLSSQSQSLIRRYISAWEDWM